MASDRTPEGLSWLRSSILTGHPRCDAIRFIRTGQCLEGSDRGSEKARTKSPAAKGRKPHSSIAMLRSSPRPGFVPVGVCVVGSSDTRKSPGQGSALQLSQAKIRFDHWRGRGIDFEPVEPLAVRCLAPGSDARWYRPAGSRSRAAAEEPALVLSLGPVMAEHTRILMRPSAWHMGAKGLP